MNLPLRKQCFTFWTVFVAVYVVGLGFLPLFLPDETRYAEIPREMLMGHHWIAPQFNGLNYFEKPAIGYWIHGASLAVFGENAFAIRLPSAMAVLISAWIVIAFLKRVGYADVRYQGATVFITFLIVASLGRLALLDSLFSMAICGCLCAYYVGLLEPVGRRQQILFVVAGACAGLAFAVKGVLGYVLPTIVLGPFLIWQLDLKKSLMTIHWVLLGALVVPLPWCVAVFREAPDFWRYFIWVEHVQRFIDAPQSQHPEPWWHYFPMLALGLLPWLFFSFRGVRFVMHAWDRRLVRFAGCWILGPLIFFTLSSGKLVTYLLPILPAFAVILSAAFQSENPPMMRLPRWSTRGLAGAVFLSGIVIAMIGPVGPYSPHETYKVGLLAVILIVQGALLAWDRTARSTFYPLSLGFAVFLGAVPFLLPQSMVHKKAPRQFFNRVAPQIDRSSNVFVEGKLVGSAAWYLRRSDLSVVGEAGELAYGLRSQPERHVSSNELSALVDSRLAAGMAVIASNRSLAGYSLPVADWQFDGDFYACRIWYPRGESGRSE